MLRNKMYQEAVLVAANLGSTSMKHILGKRHYMNYIVLL